MQENNARMGWAMRVCCLSRSLVWASDQAGPTGFSPTRVGWARPSPKKEKEKRVGWIWTWGPANPIMFIKGVLHPNALTIIFMLILVWYLAKRAFFLYQKIPQIFGDRCWFIYGPLVLRFIFFSLHFVLF